MSRSASPSHAFQLAEIEEALIGAERTIEELSTRDNEQAMCEARWLDKMTQALRLAVVAGVESSVLTRLHLRLETSLRRASTLLAEHEETPASQRPTFRPPPGDWQAEEVVAADVHAHTEDESPSERPTIRPPRSHSAILPKFNPKSRKSA